MENREFDGYNPMKRLIEKLPDVAQVSHFKVYKCLMFS